MPVIYIGIGSNVDPELHIRRAVSELRRQFGEVTCSPVYRTTAVGFAGTDFYNLVVKIETDLELQVIAAETRRIETLCGRHRQELKFGPRTIDLDILTYGETVGTFAGFGLPRPDILKYSFVLGPLAALAPHARHPIEQRTYAELWHAHETDSALTPVPDFLP